MASSGQGELRERFHATDNPVEKTDAVNNAPAGQHVSENKKVDEELVPDYILVFSNKSQPEIKKALLTLADSGFFVTCRKGASSTILVLVRAGPGVVAGSTNRALTVQQRLPWSHISGVVDKFPVHDKKTRVLTKKNKIFPILSKTKLDDIESLAGPESAAAFQFEDQMLVLFLTIALNGVSCYFREGSYSWIFSISLLSMGAIAVASWLNNEKRKNSAESTGTNRLQMRNVNYRGTSSRKRELIRLLFIPFALTLMAFYAFGLFLILALEIFCTQVYAGPFQAIVKMIPVGANVVGSQIYGIIYTYCINKFTEWEDYPTEEALEDAKNQRQFYLQALLGYLPIIFTAYLYLPFGHLLVGMVPELQSTQIVQYMTISSKFSLNEDRLLAQTRFYTLTQPVIALVMDTLMPWIMYFVKRHVLHQAQPAGNNRFALEQLMVPFDSNQEIQRIILCFGYILIVSPVWHWAALATFVVLYLRQVGVMYVLTSGGFRKPVSRRNSRDIGFWSGELKLVLLLGSMVSPTISYMCQSTSQYYDYNTSYVDASWLSIIAVALLSENVVLIIYHVAKNYQESLELPSPNHSEAEKLKAQSQIQKTPVIDADQDSLWSRLDSNVSEILS